MRVLDYIIVRPVINQAHGYLCGGTAGGSGHYRINLHSVDCIPPVNIGLDLVRAIRIAAVKAVLEIIREHGESGVVLALVDQIIVS